jgi:hypothetical protein
VGAAPLELKERGVEPAKAVAAHTTILADGAREELTVRDIPKDLVKSVTGITHISGGGA